MKSSELYRMLLRNGWYVVKQTGSHVKMKHPTIAETIIFPRHGSHEVGKGLERDILKKAGIKR